MKKSLPHGRAPGVGHGKDSFTIKGSGPGQKFVDRNLLEASPESAKHAPTPDCLVPQRKYLAGIE